MHMHLSKRALSGKVETFLLSVLKEGPGYGYGIVSALNERAPEMVRFGEGTVYPVLHRMEAKGLVESFWREGESGRRRKYYRITRKGRGALSSDLDEWEQLAVVMARMTGVGVATAE